MDRQYCIDLISRQTTDRQTIDAVRFLAPHTHDSQVMDVLCEAAVTTVSYAVRKMVIDVLTSNPAGAWPRFADVALWSRNPVPRMWAWVNLSLMGCREAKDAVISGLYDPDASVRAAAAMSAGLHADADVQDALERYFERHRHAPTPSPIPHGLNSMRIRARHLEAE